MVQTPTVVQLTGFEAAAGGMPSFAGLALAAGLAAAGGLVLAAAQTGSRQVLDLGSGRRLKRPLPKSLRHQERAGLHRDLPFFVHLVAGQPPAVRSWRQAAVAGAGGGQVSRIIVADDRLGGRAGSAVAGLTSEITRTCTIAKQVVSSAFSLPWKFKHSTQPGPVDGKVETAGRKRPIRLVLSVRRT